MALKLRQGQVWKIGEVFIRIVRLERLEVGYLTSHQLKPGEGKHRVATKKEFCRLLKTATLLATTNTNDDKTISPPPTSLA